MSLALYFRNITLEDPNIGKQKGKGIVAKGLAKVKGSASASGKDYTIDKHTLELFTQVPISNPLKAVLCS